MDVQMHDTFSCQLAHGVQVDTALCEIVNEKSQYKSLIVHTVKLLMGINYTLARYINNISVRTCSLENLTIKYANSNK